MASAYLQSLPSRAGLKFGRQLGTFGAATRSIPNSLPPFWIACALTLIVAHYQLWWRLNIGYKIMGTVVVVMMPLLLMLYLLLELLMVYILLVIVGKY